MKQHVATYALYAVTTFELFGRLKRVGTGYLYSLADIDRARAMSAKYGMPFHMRWRSEAARQQADT